MKNLFKFIKNEKGQVAVLAALMMAALLGFAAMAVDMGVLYNTKVNLQDVADTAALSGAQDLPNACAASNTAKNYAALNGVQSSETTIITPYNGDSGKIEVVCTQTVPYLFARILGFTDTKVTAHAVAQRGGLGSAFNCTLFSGSPSYPLTINGSGLYIKGDAHSNQAFGINGSNQTITGNAQAVSGISVNGSSITIGGTLRGASILVNGSNINIGTRVVAPAPRLDMPDFSDAIENQASAASQFYIGNQTFNGSNISVDGSIYVDGNVLVNGSNFMGKGCILATGNLTFNGSNLTNATGDAVCFYSKNGNIVINGSCQNLCGIVYAPNGTITLNGSNQTIKGRVIGNKVLLNGSGISIIGGTNEFLSVPGSYIKLIE